MRLLVAWEVGPQIGMILRRYGRSCGRDCVGVEVMLVLSVQQAMGIVGAVAIAR